VPLVDLHPEQLMEAHGYSEFANHKREHERMLAQVTQLLERVHGGDRPTNEAMAFLRTWLFDHILATDHRYSAFLLSKGVV